MKKYVFHYRKLSFVYRELDYVLNSLDCWSLQVAGEVRYEPSVTRY
jgi:hypothetical protein